MTTTITVLDPDTEVEQDLEVTGVSFDADPDVGCHGGWEDITLDGDLVDSAHPYWHEACDALDAAARDDRGDWC